MFTWRTGALSHRLRTRRESCKLVYDADNNCYEVTALLKTEYVVVVTVPGREAGIAAPGLHSDALLWGAAGEQKQDRGGGHDRGGHGLVERDRRVSNHPYIR